MILFGLKSVSNLPPTSTIYYHLCYPHPHGKHWEGFAGYGFHRNFGIKTRFLWCYSSHRWLFKSLAMSSNYYFCNNFPA